MRVCQPTIEWLRHGAREAEGASTRVLEAAMEALALMARLGGEGGDVGGRGGATGSGGPAGGGRLGFGAEGGGIADWPPPQAQQNVSAVKSSSS